MPTQKAAHRPAETMIRIGTAMGVPPALRCLGLDPSEVLSEGGFDSEIFNDPDNLISFATRSRLIGYCATKAKCEHFGLLLGQQVGLSSLGLVGLLMRYSEDVGTALNNLVRYFHLHAHGASVSLQIRGNSAILGYQIHQSDSETNNLIGDGALAVMFNILRELCRPGWKPTEIWILHSEPKDIKPFREFYTVPLHFNAEQYAIAFHSSCLEIPLPEVHSDLRQMVQKQIDLLAARHVDDFPEQVRAVLRAAVLNGKTNAPHVASLFSMHPRTLSRHLGEYGIRYQQLMDEIRFEMARQMLNDSRLDINAVALVLHYADARSFIQAFRRWSGTTPARWRASQKQLRRRNLTT